MVLEFLFENFKLHVTCQKGCYINDVNV